MACKVTSGGMFSRLFGAETTCLPDGENYENKCCTDTVKGGSLQSVMGVIQDLSSILDDVSSAALNNIPMAQIRSLLQDSICAFEAPTISADERAELLRRVLALDLPAKMLAALSCLEFEARKDVMRFFHQILQDASGPVLHYVHSHQQVLQLLVAGCGKEDIALHCHMMLRSCTQQKQIVVCMLQAGFASELVKLAHHQIFDISSDAFSSLHALLLTHKSVAATYLEVHFKEFFESYSDLLRTENYATNRQALRLLGEIVLDRKYSKVMKLYIQEAQFLQVLMNLLRDNSKAIQVDAFHVFKVFAAASDKRPRVHQILIKNRDRLVKLLESLGEENNGESFLQDQRAVVEALWSLESLPAKTALKL